MEGCKKDEGKTSSSVSLRYRVRNNLLFVWEKSARLSTWCFSQTALAWYQVQREAVVAPGRSEWGGKQVAVTCGVTLPAPQRPPRKSNLSSPHNFHLMVMCHFGESVLSWQLWWCPAGIKESHSKAVTEVRPHQKGTDEDLLSSPKMLPAHLIVEQALPPLVWFTLASCF